MAMKTQGTQLYFYDPVAKAMVAIDCVTGISGISASRDQIETTCLEGQAREYEAGMPTPGTATAGINIDTKTNSHMALHALYTSGEKVDWAVGFSDGTAAPTVQLDSNGDPVLDSDGNIQITYPTTRTWLTFDGYVQDFPFDFTLNGVVTSSITLQVSGFPTLLPKV